MRYKTRQRAEIYRTTQKDKGNKIYTGREGMRGAIKNYEALHREQERNRSGIKERHLRRERESKRTDLFEGKG